MGKIVGETSVYSREVGLEERFSYVASGNGVGQVEYHGWAQHNSSQDAAVWRICRYTYDSSHRLTAIEWAGGDDAFNQIFANRTTLAY